MSRTRLFILLAAFFIMASAVWADDLGYVDCSAHPENTQVFAKPRQTPDSAATVACGERFAILLNGFIFSRVQTKDGKVGYVYSSLITVDHGQAGPAQSAVGRVPAASAPAAPAANARPAVANAATAAPAYAQPAPGSQAASMPVTTSPPQEKPAASSGPLFPTPPMPAVTAADVNYSSSAQSAQAAPTVSAAPASTPAASVQAAPAASQPSAPAPLDSQAATKPTPASASVSATPSTPASASITATASVSAPASSQPSSSAPAPAPAALDPQPASSAPSQSSAPAQPGPLFPTPPPAPASPTSSAPDAAPAPAPAAADSAPASQPQPEAAQPSPEPVRSLKARESWEAPVAGARQSFLMELYGGYAFARFTSAGTSANLSGGLGSFGWNLRPWLQIVGDNSYNFATTSGAKSVLYGNHFGARYFYRSARFGMGRRGITPFVEALVGGSRVDTTVSGPGGYKTSVNCLSYKAGGGIDFHFSPHWEVRLINVDYYRTTFGANGYSAAQNNYWASAGVVFRLFGARSE